MNPRIRGFHQDEQGHWIAELECGHDQRLRHAPPWINRLWVTSEQGRSAALGSRLCCRRCAQLGSALPGAIDPRPGVPARSA